MRGWCWSVRSCQWIMASFVLRAASSRVMAKSFLPGNKGAAFSVLPDSLRSSSSRRTQQTPPGSSTFTQFRSLSSYYSKKTSSKNPPKMYTRKTVRVKGKSGNVEPQRLYRADRVLANRSGRSRSECFDLLQEKRVWQYEQYDPNETNNDSDSDNDTSSKLKVLVKGPSIKISMHTPLWIDQTETVPLPPQLLHVYHKPVWVLSVRSDPTGRPCLDKDELLPNMHPVGRLE
jgi:hypothetical protein